MKHIHKIEQKCSETKLYQYFVGMLIKLIELAKVGCKAIFRHVIEVLMIAAIISIIVVAEVFDSGAIAGTTAILFIAILGAVIVTLIKIKITESRANKK